MKEERILYWAYDRLLWMLTVCILLLGVWIFAIYNILLANETAKITGIMFVVAFISFASYIWEKRESWSRELNNK